MRVAAFAYLAVLLWSDLGLCAEIHDAAADGNLGRVKALLKKQPTCGVRQGQQPDDAVALGS